MVSLLKMLVYEMHSYSTPMAPFVKEVIEYIAKFFVGEEYELGSDYVLKRASSSTAGNENNDSAYYCYYCWQHEGLSEGKVFLQEGWRA